MDLGALHSCLNDLSLHLFLKLQTHLHIYSFLMVTSSFVSLVGPKTAPHPLSPALHSLSPPLSSLAPRPCIPSQHHSPPVHLDSRPLFPLGHLSLPTPTQFTHLTGPSLPPLSGSNVFLPLHPHSIWLYQAWVPLISITARALVLETIFPTHIAMPSNFS